MGTGGDRSRGSGLQDTALKRDGEVIRQAREGGGRAGCLNGVTRRQDGLGRATRRHDRASRSAEPETGRQNGWETAAMNNAAKRYRLRMEYYPGLR